LEQLNLTDDEVVKLCAEGQMEVEERTQLLKSRYSNLLDEPQPHAVLRNGLRIPLVGLGTWYGKPTHCAVSFLGLTPAD
jgi:diketogulonate reductase-like aldo/keto reductase